MSKSNRLTSLGLLISVVTVMVAIAGRMDYFGDPDEDPPIEGGESASDDERTRPKQAQPTATIDLLDTLTPTELVWAGYIYHCVGEGLEFDRVVVRRSTLAQTFKILGGDLYDKGREPVWIVAYVSRSPVPNDVLRLGGENPFDSVATVLAATPYSSVKDVPTLPTLNAPYGADARNRTTGYCAINEKGDWVAKEIVPPVIAEYFMAEIEQLPRTP